MCFFIVGQQYVAITTVILVEILLQQNYSYIQLPFSIGNTKTHYFAIWNMVLG